MGSVFVTSAMLSVHITAAERVPDTGRKPLQSTTPAYCVRDMGITKLSVYNIQPHTRRMRLDKIWPTCSNKTKQVGRRTKIIIDWAWTGVNNFFHGHSLAGALKAKLRARGR